MLAKYLFGDGRGGEGRGGAMQCPVNMTQEDPRALDLWDSGVGLVLIANAASCGNIFKVAKTREMTCRKNACKRIVSHK